MGMISWLGNGVMESSANAANANGDADNDRDVDGDDLGIWKGRFGTGGGYGSVVIREH